MQRLFRLYERRETLMARQEQHASPETLLGQLQRGRGQGYIRILSVPKDEASKLLIECITNDPRLDGQVEARAEYYAAIAVEVGLDLARLAQYLRENDDADQAGWNTPLAVDTLGQLAQRGCRNAAEILCDYVGWGQWWDWPLENLMAVSDSNLPAKVARAIERHFPSDDELEKAVDWFYLDDMPWARIVSQSARIGKFRNNLRKKEGISAGQNPPIPNLTSLTTERLLELADKTNCYKLRKVIGQLVTPADIDILMTSASVDRPYVAAVAFAGLAHLAPESIFGWLKQFWSSNPEMPGFVRVRAAEAMTSLPPTLTLPLAEKWLFHERSHERFLAEDLFEAHARNQDVPLLRTAIREALKNDLENCYRLCALVDAFSNFPCIGPVPELFDVFVQFRYSYGRAISAHAISVTAPDLFREKFSLECLWDCEDRSRLLATKLVPTENAVAARRLHELASNVWEDKEVQTEAEKRLAQ